MIKIGASTKIEEISKKTRMHRNTISKYMQKLEEAGIVVKKQIGKNLIYVDVNQTPTIDLLEQGFKVVVGVRSKFQRVSEYIFSWVSIWRWGIKDPLCGMKAYRIDVFNQLATELNGTKVLAISKDLPFAHARFCTSEGIENVINLSEFKCSSFGKDYGLEIIDGPLAGLFSRAVIVLDEQGNVIYTQQVPEIVDEPNYDEVLEALK